MMFPLCLLTSRRETSSRLVGFHHQWDVAPPRIILRLDIVIGRKRFNGWAGFVARRKEGRSAFKILDLKNRFQYEGLD